MRARSSRGLRCRHRRRGGCDDHAGRRSTHRSADQRLLGGDAVCRPGGRREPRGVARDAQPPRGDRRARTADGDDGPARQRGRRPVQGPRREHVGVHLHAGRQHRQDPVHPSADRRRRAVRVLHPRRRDGQPVVLRRHVPVLGADHRPPGRGGGDGRLPQLDDPVVGPRGGPVPRRSRRLRRRPEARDRAGRRTAHRPGAHRRRRRERRRQPHPRHRSAPRARRRDRSGPRAVRAVPVHRRLVAAGPLPLVDGEQRPADRRAQQRRRGGLRHRRAGGGQPAGVADLRHGGRRHATSRRR